MKKNIIGLAACGFLFSLLAGCGGSALSSSEGAASSGNASNSSEAGSGSSGSPSSASISGYSNGHTTNSEPHDYENIIVNGPTNELNPDFSFGADCSIVHEIESLGGRYYDENGNEEDIFKLLAADGLTAVRLRLWVDPYNSLDGEPYGGGTNDLPTDIFLAQRAKAAGLKVLLDFHYSDFWADPSHYWSPKAWSSLPKSQLPAKLGAYTKDALQSFKDAGVSIDQVGIGNETNTGMAGVLSSTSISANNVYVNLIKAGIAASKEVFPEALTSVHLTNIKSGSAVYDLLDSLQENGCDFDAVGISYYPYWHGSKDNLQTVLGHIVSSTGKPVYIAETAWGFTDEQTPYATNQFSTSGFGLTGGYLTSEQGQITEMADLIDILSKVPNQQGIGIYYWEPDWLPVEGSYWATKEGEYYNDNGRDASSEVCESLYTDDSRKQSWANQAWFSYTGKALATASVYKHIKARDKEAPETVLGLVKDELSLTINLKGGSWSLPSSVQGYTNTGAYRDLPVVWDADEEAAISEDGIYEVHGEAQGFPVLLTVTAESNFVQDYSFENQKMSGQEAAVQAPWEVSANTPYGNYGTGHIEAKGEGNLDGTKYYHWYNNVDFTWNLSQTLTVDWAGVYRLRTYLMANASSGYRKMTLWIKAGDSEPLTADCLSACQGWNSDLSVGMKECVLGEIPIPVPGTTVSFGMECSGLAGSWGHMDLWSLVKTGELPS